MKLIIILIALAIVGLLTVKQMRPHGDADISADLPAGTSETGAPRVPTKPEDTEQFRNDLNDFVLQQSKERDAELEQSGAR